MGLETSHKPRVHILIDGRIFDLRHHLLESFCIFMYKFITFLLNHVELLNDVFFPFDDLKLSLKGYP